MSEVKADPRAPQLTCPETTLQHASPVPAGEKRRGLALKQECQSHTEEFQNKCCGKTSKCH